MAEDLRSTGVQLPESQYRALDKLAEHHGTTRSAVIRAAIDTGLRAQKYDEQYALDPERFDRDTIAERKAQASDPW